jgi:hypothetical protein
VRRPAPCGDGLRDHVLGLTSALRVGPTGWLATRCGRVGRCVPPAAPSSQRGARSWHRWRAAEGFCDLAANHRSATAVDRL